jgi:hypothetical protein
MWFHDVHSVAKRIRAAICDSICWLLCPTALLQGYWMHVSTDYEYSKQHINTAILKALDLHKSIHAHSS